MMSPCDGVAERLACGEPLAELAPHAEDCPRCQGLLAAERQLTACVSGPGRSVEPARGFTARMTVVASQRLVSRHRWRVASYATLSAAAAAMLTFALVREPARPAQVAERAEAGRAPQPAAKLPGEPIANPWEAGRAPGPGESDEDARELLILARSYAAPVSANWREIEWPLRAYRQLLSQVEDQGDDGGVSGEIGEDLTEDSTAEPAETPAAEVVDDEDSEQ